MDFNFGAIVYLTAVFAVSAFFLPGNLSGSFRARTLIAYACCAYLVILFEDYFQVLFIGGVLLAAIAPLQRVERTAFFIAAVPALPVYFSYHVPFPGLQYLVTLTPMLLVVLVVLIPAAVAGRPREETLHSDGWRAPVALVLLSLYWGVMLGDAVTASSGLRKMVTLLLVLAVPYVLLERHIRSMAAFETVVRAFVAAAAILAVYAMLATALQWDIYRYREIFTIANFPDFRSGFLRIQATANTHSLAYFAACAIFFVAWLKRKGDYSWPRALILQALLFATMLSTDSRGALLSFFFAVAVYLGIVTKRRWVRSALVSAILIGGIVLAVQLLSANDEIYDEHGTFAYRRELLFTFIAYIQQHPIFGDIKFLSGGNFEHLRVGAGPGHIDVTNLYLFRALELGLIGFTLYFYVFFRTLFFSTKDATGQISVEQAMLKSLMAGWLVLVATTSDVGITEFIGILLAGLSVAVKNVRQGAGVTHSAVAGRPRVPIAVGRPALSS